MEHTSRFDSRYGPDGPRYHWVGIVVEVAPGKFMHCTVQAHEVVMDFSTETEPIGDELLSAYRTVSRTLRLQLEGTVGRYEPTERPEWATEPAGELTEGPRQITGAHHG